MDRAAAACGNDRGGENFLLDLLVKTFYHVDVITSGGSQYKDSVADEHH